MCEITRSKTFGIPPKLASGNSLQENVHDFASLDEVFQVTRVCELALFKHRVSVGRKYQTRPDEDDVFGQFIPFFLRIHTPPQSRFFAAILGGSTIGPVIAVHIVKFHGKYGLEIATPYPNNPTRTSYVVISQSRVTVQHRHQERAVPYPLVVAAVSQKRSGGARR